MQNPYLCIGFCGNLYPHPAEFVNIAAGILLYMYARERNEGGGPVWGLHGLPHRACKGEKCPSSGNRRKKRKTYTIL